MMTPAAEKRTREARAGLTTRGRRGTRTGSEVRQPGAVVVGCGGGDGCDDGGDVEVRSPEENWDTRLAGSDISDGSRTSPSTVAAWAWAWAGGEVGSGGGDRGVTCGGRVAGKVGERGIEAELRRSCCCCWAARKRVRREARVPRAWVVVVGSDDAVDCGGAPPKREKGENEEELQKT